MTFHDLRQAHCTGDWFTRRKPAAQDANGPQFTRLSLP